MTRALYRPKSQGPELHPISRLVLEELALRAAPSWHSSDYDALGNELYGETIQGDNWGRSMSRK